MSIVGISDSLIAAILYSIHSFIIYGEKNPVDAAIRNTLQILCLEGELYEPLCQYVLERISSYEGKKLCEKCMVSRREIDIDALAVLLHEGDHGDSKLNFGEYKYKQIARIFVDQLKNEILADPKTSIPYLSEVVDSLRSITTSCHGEIILELQEIKEKLFHSLNPKLDELSGAFSRQEEKIDQIYQKLNDAFDYSAKLREKEAENLSLRKKIEELDAELERLKVEAPSAKVDMAYSQFLDGDVDAALNLFLDIRRRQKDEQKAHALAAYTLGNIYFIKLMFKEALSSYLEACKLDDSNSEYYKTVGTILGFVAQFKESIEYFKKAVSIDIRNLGENNKEVADSFNMIGLGNLGLGLYEKALSYFNKAITIDVALYGEETTICADRYLNIGIAYKNIENFDRAIEYYQKALVIYGKTVGVTHKSYGKCLNNMGNIYMRVGNLTAAKNMFQQALSIDIINYGTEHPEVAKRFHNIGLALGQLDQFEESIRYLNKAIDLDTKVFGQNHPELAEDYRSVAIAYLNNQKFHDAIEWLKKSINIDKEHYGGKNPILTRAYQLLSNCWLALGDKQKYEYYASKANSITDGRRHERPRSFTYDHSNISK